MQINDFLLMPLKLPQTQLQPMDKKMPPEKKKREKMSTITVAHDIVEQIEETD